MQDMFKEMSAASCRYRDACAAAASAPGTVLLRYDRGHGTSLMAMQAGMRAGAKTMLFVVPKAMQEMWIEQLDQEHYAAMRIDPRRGSMSDACRQAAAYTGSKPVAFLAAPNQMAEAGHWHEAWRDKTAFGFVAVLDGESFYNLKSEKSRGLKSVTDRSGNAVLLVERGAPDSQVHALIEAWGLPPCPVAPSAAPMAASACEAMGMDA